MGRVTCPVVLVMLLLLALKLIGVLDVSWWYFAGVPVLYYVCILIDGFLEFRRRR